MAETRFTEAQLPAVPTPPAAPAEVPVQVDRSVFLAARIRELLATEANLRTLVAELQLDNAKLRSQQAQTEIDELGVEYDVSAGTILQKRTDGTYWRIPKSALQNPQA